MRSAINREKEEWLPLSQAIELLAERLTNEFSSNPWSNTPEWLKSDARHAAKTVLKTYQRFDHASLPEGVCVVPKGSF